MGIFSGIFKSRDAPTNRTAGSAYSFFLGQSAAGKRVNERSAMQTSAVYACVRVISESVASLPLHLYRYNKDGGKEKAIDHPLYLNQETNEEIVERTLELYGTIAEESWFDDDFTPQMFKDELNAGS